MRKENNMFVYFEKFDIQHFCSQLNLANFSQEGANISYTKKIKKICKLCKCQVVSFYTVQNSEIIDTVNIGPGHHYS